MERRHWVVLHRWTGLMLVAFLLVVGLTGSVLPFYRDLDRAISPHMLTVEVPEGRAAIDPLILREQVLTRHPEFRIDSVPLARLAADDALVFYVDGRLAELAYDELYVDPYTGKELGTRRWGDLSQGRINLMPFLYRLHYSLAAGTPGRTVLGVVALLWTLDCFVGAWLTLPPRMPRRDGALVQRGKGWWSRWAKAWRLRLASGGYRFGFDFHRAAGLWLWAILFVMAWSAVSFNLSQVYRPVMGALFGPWQPAPVTDQQRSSLDDRRVDWGQARERGRALMAEFSAVANFRMRREAALSLDRAGHMWRYVVASDRDVSQRGATTIFFDADTGAFLASHLPTGGGAAQTGTTWMTSLHTARIGGLPMRLGVSATGLMVAALCVTGVVIWGRKRTGRQRGAVPKVNLGQPQG